MKFDIKHILIFGLALGMTSCVETMKDGDMSTGFLGIPVLDADIQVEEFGATKAAPKPPTLSVPDHSKLHFKVTGSDSKVVWDKDGRWSDPLKMPVGSYTIEVTYGPNTYGDPWYTGTCTGTISAVTEAVPAIGLRLCNSLLAVDLANDLTPHFTPSEENEGKCVTISSTSGNITTTLGKYVFVPAEETLTIQVAGTNSTGESKILSRTLKNPLSAATATCVTCSLTTTDDDAPKIKLDGTPEAWGTVGYIPVATTANISDANVAKMKYFASSNDWTDSVEGTVDGGTVKFTGLTPGATYKVLAQIGALKSNEVSMTMSTSALSIKTAAAHTKTDNQLDGTDFTASFSVDKKFGVTASSLQLYNADGTLLRTVELTGTSADWISDGSKLTGTDTWPFLPGGNYKLKGTATQNGSTVTLADLPISVPATPDFTVTVTGTTTYDLYSSGNITAANAADAESITGIEYSVSGIAQRLKDNINYSYKEELLLDNVDIKGKTSVSKQSWDSHTLIAKVTFASKEIIAQKYCHVTGLPLQFTKKTEYEKAGWSCNASGNTTQTYSFYNDDLLTSPTFYFPKTTNVAVIIDISPSSGTTGSFTCNGNTQTFTKSGGTKNFDITLDKSNTVTLKASIDGVSARYCKLNNTKVQYR